MRRGGAAAEKEPVMKSQETAFAHLLHHLVVHNCQQRGTRYRVWHDGQLVGEFGCRAEAEGKAGSIRTGATGQVTIEEIW
jgi:hypothetical protein